MTTVQLALLRFAFFKSISQALQNSHFTQNQFCYYQLGNNKAGGNVMTSINCSWNGRTKLTYIYPLNWFDYLTALFSEGSFPIDLSYEKAVKNFISLTPQYSSVLWFHSVVYYPFGGGYFVRIFVWFQLCADIDTVHVSWQVSGIVQPEEVLFRREFIPVTQNYVPWCSGHLS